MYGGGVLLRITTALLLLALLSPRGVRAEEMEETEYRLKTAGIEAPLRKRIHKAIDRGVGRLLALQRKRGSAQSGKAVLVALALRHAGSPKALRRLDQVIEYLTTKAQRSILANTYEVGLAAMLLHADHSHQDFSRRIHERLAAGGGSSGYWGYSPTGSSVGNLSTAQYGALGLWASERQGAPVAGAAWRRVLGGLIDNQQSDGSWGYTPKTGARLGSAPTYITGTFMGYANLVLASRSLADVLADDDDLSIKTLMARARAEAALRRDVQRMFATPHVWTIVSRMQVLYSLFALEKACVFYGQVRVGGVEWYREGAERLLETQGPDGGWAEHGLTPANARRPGRGKRAASDAIGTSFALLFLLRASESYRPISPRPVGRGTVITGGSGATSDGASLGTRSPHLGLATRILEQLEATLKQPRLRSPRTVLSAFRFIRRAYPDARKGEGFASPEHDAWCRRAEGLLLTCSSRFANARVSPHRDWLGIGFDALATLASTHPRVAPALMQRITVLKRNKRFPEEARIGWYGTAVETLRRLRPKGLDTWLTTHVVSAGSEEAALSLAGLVALGGRAYALTGSERHAVAGALYETFQPLVRRGNTPGLRTSKVIESFRVTMQRLAEAGGARDFPHPADTLYLDVLAGRVLNWWKQHRNPDDPIWQDKTRR